MSRALRCLVRESLRHIYLVGAPRDESGRASSTPMSARATLPVVYGEKSYDVRARASSSPGLLEREIVEVFDGVTGHPLGFAIVMDGTRVAGVGRRSSHVTEADVRAIVATFLHARSSKVSATRRRVVVAESDVPRLLRELADLVEEEGIVGPPAETIERVVRAVLPALEEETATHLRERLSLLRSTPDSEEEPSTKR